MTFKVRVLSLRKWETQTLQGRRPWDLLWREHASAEGRRGGGWELRPGWKEGIGQPGLDNLGLNDMGASGGAE